MTGNRTRTTSLEDDREELTDLRCEVKAALPRPPGRGSPRRVVKIKTRKRSGSKTSGKLTASSRRKAG